MRTAGPGSRCGTRTCPVRNCGKGTTSPGTRTCRGSFCALRAGTPDLTRTPEAGGLAPGPVARARRPSPAPGPGALRGHYPQEIGYERGALHERMCTLPHSYISGSGLKGLNVEIMLVVRTMRRRCFMASLPATRPTCRTTAVSHRRGQDHYRVTLPWLCLASGVA